MPRAPPRSPLSADLVPPRTNPRWGRSSPRTPLSLVLVEEGALAVCASVCYTRALTDDGVKLYLPRGVRIAPGRPRTLRLLDGLLMRTIAAARPRAALARRVSGLACADGLRRSSVRLRRRGV
jgi:hypothetical protein